MARRRKGEIYIDRIPLALVESAPRNPKDHDIGAIIQSYDRFGFVAPGVRNDATGRIVVGHGRAEALRQLKADGQPPPERVLVAADGDWLVPVVCGITFANDAEAEAYLIADNRLTNLGGWDDAALVEVLKKMAEEDTLQGTGFDGDDVDALMLALDKEAAKISAKEGRGRLLEEFGVPPFTTLDARQGYWKARKRAWRAVGVHGEEGRENLPDTVNTNEGTIGYLTGFGPGTGGSVFDPVLAELVYRWFNIKGGTVLDPFAGECTKGMVACYMGMPYLGVELRGDQVATNKRQMGAADARVFAGPKPKWITGDSLVFDATVPKRAKADLVFTSPPYYDLEVYSNEARDGSTHHTYAQFLEWYRSVFDQVVARLRDNRFLVVKVGDIRDKVGGYRGFTADTYAMFTDMGLHLYNQAVLITPVGSAAIRAGGPMRKWRKMAKTHQDVLVFWKGDPKAVREVFEDVQTEFGDPGAEADEG